MVTTIEIPLSEVFALSVTVTERADGDFSVHRSDVDRRRRALVDLPWTWLHLEHGTTVVQVVEPGDHAGVRADAAATSTLGAALSVTTADCAPVVMSVLGSTGIPALAVVHAGWRGLASGVIEAAAGALESLAGPVAQATTAAAWCGPCIGPEDYEFSPSDLAVMVDRYGPAVKSTTGSGAPALDLVASVREALAGVGLELADRPHSTAEPRYYSHRVRGDSERMVTVARLVTTDDDPSGIGP
jgi:copper oxidase (laccase) domain-containing protein